MKDRNDHATCSFGPMDISDQDVMEAMKSIEGYLDITPADFKLVYRLAYSHAMQRTLTNVRAREVMTREVVFVPRDTPLDEVAEIMASHNISGVPVVDPNRIVLGVISEKDFLTGLGPKNASSFMEVLAHCLKGTGCIAVSMRKQSAGDIMTTPAITVGEDVSVSKISEIFNVKKINRVPVTDSNGRLIGIVSRADIVRCSVIGSE